MDGKMTKNYKNKLLTAKSPFVVSEAYRSLRTNLMYTGCADKCPVFVVTSSAPNEGKSLNCANLALSYAQIGKRTLIIDLDMRVPSQHITFDIENQNGASAFLAGVVDAPNFIKTEYENLSLMVVGRTPPDPTELLNSPRFPVLLEKAKEQFDVIFLDVPPIGVMSDASIIAKYVSGYLVVMESGVSDKRELFATINTIEKVGGNILGFILNCVDFKTDAAWLEKYGKTGKRMSSYANAHKKSSQGK